MTRLFKVFAIMCLALASMPVYSRESPEAYLKGYFDDIGKRGLAATVDYIHPDEADRFKAMILPMIEATPKEAEGAVTERLFGARTSAANLKSMPSMEFMRKFIIGALGPARTMGIGIQSLEVLGQVPEKDLMHVVARVRTGNDDLQMRKVQVITLMPYQDGWKMMLTGDMEGVARQLRSMSK